MAVHFRDVRCPPLQALSIVAPTGSIIGVLGDKASGATEVLRLAAGLLQPESGEVQFEGTRRYLGLTDSLNFSPVNVLAIDHAFAQADALVRGRALVSLDRLRAGGGTVLLATHERLLMKELCDEVWWLDGGKVVRQGDPREVLDAYYSGISEKLRAWGETLSVPVTPAMRKGDGRAEIISLEVLGASGKATAVLESGEHATVRALVRFRDKVADPVFGIMIRNRIGLEVFGTNTELEKTALGAVDPGTTLQIDFHLRCDLGPKDYTLTAASHDPDGTAHDWLDDAVAFQVTSRRPIAGVANLPISVEVSRQ